MNNGYVITRKAIHYLDWSIDKILTVLFLIMLCIGAYFTYDSWYVFNSSSLNKIPGYTWEGPATLEELPTEAIAWLEIYDTKIDCPLMQGETNREYLNKNPYGEYSLAGSIFLDSRNSFDFTDPYSVLYGHHMSGGYMFGSLDEFLKEEYFLEHRDGVLTLRDDTEYEVEIFAVLETDASNETVFNVSYDADRFAFIKENAFIYREPSGDRILALTTCKSPLTTERYAVFATLKDKK